MVDDASTPHPCPGPQGPLQRFLSQPYIKLMRAHLGPEMRTIVMMGIVSGLSNGAIVAIINAGATSHQKGEDELFRYVMMFGVAVMLFLYTCNYLLTKSVIHSEQIVQQFRTRIADRIRRSELFAFDELETTQVFVTLSDNTNRISNAALPIFNACGAVVMLIFCLSYILTISSAAFFITIAVTLAIAFIYMQVAERVEHLFGQAYAAEKSYFHHVQQLLDGIKEVKMSSARSDDLFSRFIRPRADEAYGHNINANEAHVRNFLNTRLFIFLITASFVFGLPTLEMVSNEDIMSLTAVALFMFSPIGAVVEAIPQLAQANVAVTKLYDLEGNLAATETPGPDSLPAVPDRIPGVRLRGAEFSYRSKDNEVMFTVGPIDMDLEPGCINFLVGGNGSGKSTLLKMLTCLYPLDRGTLQVGPTEVTPDLRAYAREHFATIFSDFHIFDRFYGLRDTDPARVNDLIRTMRLDHKTSYKGDQYTNTELSTGQRKRLALIVSLLEDRPIYIFDEVASDQDPDFRAFFYKVVLADLRKRDKVILVVSHDQEFFGLADRLYQLDYGKIRDGVVRC